VSATAIASRSDFVAAVQRGFEAAAREQARRILCVDPDFAEWPLDDEGLHALLTRWLHLPQRRLVLLAAHYDELPRRHPRFVAWRRYWSHAIETWVAPEEGAAELPTVLVDDGTVSVNLVDVLHWRGRVESDAGSARVWCDRIDALLQRSQPGLGASTLGL